MAVIGEPSGKAATELDLFMMDEEIVSLKAQLNKLTIETTDLRSEHEELTKQIAAKDAVIKDQDQELRALRKDSDIKQVVIEPNDEPVANPSSSDLKDESRDHIEEYEDGHEEPKYSENLSDQTIKSNVPLFMLPSRFNMKTLKASAYGMSLPLRIGVFFVAFAGFLFVLVMTSPRMLGEDPASAASSASVDEPHRRLGGDVSPIMKNTAFCVACAGLIAFIANQLNLPLILGYLLGGVFVGPIGLQIVPSHTEILALSSLGKFFLLFMVGLELDVVELLRMGKVVLLSGAVQFPLCSALHYVILLALTSAGLSLGDGSYAVLYAAVCCSKSSTMLVVKQLSAQGDWGTKPGRLSIGIVISQNMWSIIVIALQPHLGNLLSTDALETIAWIAVLTAVVLLYAKYVVPVMLVAAEKTVELMIVLALAWCFFVGCIAMLPFIGLPLELACLIAGVGLASFPFSNEFNGKIKYIRDFFITLFFVGLGMQVPPIELSTILTALLVTVVVLLCRWVGIYLPVVLLGGQRRLGGIATINLSEIGEFALVICSLGVTKGHVDSETLTILIWAFIFLAVLSSFLLRYNHRIYLMLSRTFRKILGMQVAEGVAASPHREEKVIVLLGFHRIAAMLIDELEQKSPGLLKKVHVIDVNQDARPQLLKREISFTYGDYKSEKVLHHAHRGDPHIVISTTPDSVLKGVTNMELLQLSKHTWPDAYTVVTAESPPQAMELYKNGANYVLRSARLVAERLHRLLNDYSTQVGRSQLVNIADIFLHHKEEDNRKLKALKPLGSFARY